jgi:ATP-dependent Clp protease ATP-binding subunit ClpC
MCVRALQEKACRTLFFARYEASQFGSPQIESEHLLLGILRENKTVTRRFLNPQSSWEDIRKKIEEHTIIREKVSTSVDLRLSSECQRILTYAAEEADARSHTFIGTEHLLVGILREQSCFAAKLLNDRGVSLESARIS